MILLLSVSTVFADGPVKGIFAAADKVAAELPRKLDADGELLIGGVTYNQLYISLGDLIADLVANRLTGRNDFRTGVVKWYANPDYPPARASWMLTGNLYATGSSYILTLHVNDAQTGAQVIGWDFPLDSEDVDGLLEPSALADMASWDEYEPNDSPAEAHLVNLPFSAAGLNLGEGDEDWFSFEVDSLSGGNVLMLHAATTGSTDTYLELYSPDDQTWPVAENDDYDGGNAMIEMPLTTPGTWLLKVRAFDSGTSGEYGLELASDTTSLGPGEPDEGTENASVLNVGRPPVEKRIDYTSDSDWFRIVLTRPLGHDEVLRVETLGDMDTVIEILDEYEGLILSDDDSGSDSNAMAMVSGLDAGTYYAVVSGYSGTVGNYSIMANITVPVTDEYEDDSSMSQASSISVGESQQRSFSPVGDEDWVSFTISSEGYYTVYTSGDLDTYMELYDGDGNLLEENDDGDDYNATIERRFTAGTYFVKVTPYGNASPEDSYTLKLESSN